MGLQLSRNMNQADPIIIVGLGGLGGGVIDSLKGKIKHDYDDIDRVEMRIVDMTSHIKNTHMTDDEIIILDPREQIVIEHLDRRFLELNLSMKV